MAKHKSDDVRARAVELYREGMPAPTVGREVGVGSTTIYRWLKAEGLVPAELIATGRRAKFGGVSEKLADQMEEMYRAGKSIYEIGESLGSSGNRVHRILRQRGVEIRRRGGVRLPLDAEEAQVALALWAEGEAVQAIADVIGAGRERVKQCLRDAGIDPVRRVRRGERHRSWKSGATMTAGGYRYVIVRDGEPNDDMRNSLGYVAEHRLVMARAIGRSLGKHETVHHINGVRDDNRLENLQLRTGNHGKGVAMVCRSCGSHDVEAVELAG